MEKETKCIQAGYVPKNGEPRMIPIIQSTTFKYDTSEDMGKLFDLEAEGYFYYRILQMITWQPKSVHWKVDQLQCLPLQDRQLLSSQFSTSAVQEIM